VTLPIGMGYLIMKAFTPTDEQFLQVVSLRFAGLRPELARGETPIRTGRVARTTRKIIAI
jgi:hypothetical protein